MRFDRENDSEHKSPKWIVTYADLTTLLLVFFVLLFASSQIDANKFGALTDSFQSGSTSPENKEPPFEATAPNEDHETTTSSGSTEETQQNMERVLQRAKSMLQEYDLGNNVVVTRQKKGVVIVLQNDILFDTGQAMLRDDATDFLQKTAELLNTIPYDVRVEGHTDNRPISSFRYPSNWELSSARAAGVIRHFVQQHSLRPQRFSAVGYGEHQPVASNKEAEGREENRRVEIVIVNPLQDQGS